MRIHIELEGEQVPAEVLFSRRRSIALHLFSDGTIRIRAPGGYPLSDIEQFIEQKRRWLLGKRRAFLQAAQPPRLKYQAGEMHPFLGRFRPLRLEQAAVNQVCLESDTIVIRQRQPGQPVKTRQQLEGWYRQQALQLLPGLLAECMTLPAFTHLPQPSLRLRRMRSRWGSCSRDGRIALNTLLVMHPIEAIRYVIVHELCHLSEFNHGEGFYRLLDAAMPDWRLAAARLGN